MDISLLKTFLEVSRTRNFARAAENLYVTSAAVSARIKQLEGHLDVPLFVRHKGNMQLTNEGERLVPLAESMITTWARARQEVSLQPELQTRIHLGATSSMWQFSMQHSLMELLQQHPEVAVRAEGHSNEDLSRLLLDKTLDLVILPDPPSVTGVASEKVGEITLVLAADRQCSVEEAMGDGYIYDDWGTAFAGFHAEKFGERLSKVSVNLASIAVSLLEKRRGAAYVPQSSVDENEWLVAVKGAPAFKRAIYACYQEGNPRLALIQSFVSSLKGLSV
ncbi:MAG: LysR family transcriptional regulator [Proteobacteria bacterium]|nr:LysR family transcriptional regulator [Pseudomonadota bacterium]